MDYIVFAGGSWLWVGDKPGEVVLGDLIGPFGSWTEACEYLQKEWPLVGDSDEELRQMYAELIHPVRSPAAWGHFPLTDDVPSGKARAAAMTELSEAIGDENAVLKEEIAHYWQTHSV